jgi:hypothetical protein
MKGSDILSQLRDSAKKLPAEPTAQVTVTPDPPEPDDGSQEASDRCGIENGRYAQQGLIITDSQNIPLGLMYSGIQNTIRWLEPAALEFRFEDDRGLFEVLIIGADSPEAIERLKLLQLRLITQRRETLHTGNKSIIKEIRITKVEESEDDE